MTVSITSIGLGTTPGDGTGDPARTAGGYVNTNFTNVKNAVESLQAGGWEKDNASATLVRGEKIICDSGGSIVKTLPAAAAISTTANNDIFVMNVTGSAVTITPQTGETITLNGVAGSVSASATLPDKHMAVCVSTATNDWDVFLIPTQELTLAIADLSDVSESAPATDELLAYTGSGWTNKTKEELTIVDVDVPAFGANPYVLLTDHGTVTGTATITCADEPASLVKVGANNVTIALTVPSLSLPERGQAAVKLGGIVHVLIDASTRTGLTVTTTAGTEMDATFPKGTAPTTANDRASLVWYWIDNGTTDVMWAEWVPSS
jgi:hypothetical protein